MFKNVARVRDLFVSRNQRNSLIPTAQDISQIDQKYFVKHRDNRDPFQTDSKIIEELEMFIVENKIILANQLDFGVSIDELRMIHSIYQALIEEYQVDDDDQKPLEYYLTRIRIFQLETEVELARVQNDEQKEREHVRQQFVMKKIEEAETSFKTDLVEKSTKIAELAHKVEDLEVQNQKAQSQLSKIISSKIDDKTRIEGLESEKQKIVKELSSTQIEKAHLEKELAEMNQSAAIFQETLKTEKQKFSNELAHVRSNLNESTLQQKQKSQEVERLRNTTRALESKNRKLIESTPQPSSTADDNIPLFIISIDINNVERSLNINNLGLRLFNVKDFFTDIFKILVETTKSVDIYNVLGYVFCSAQNYKFKAEAERIEGDLANFISLFEWHKTRLTKGYIPNTNKKKNQDVDTLMVAKTVEAIVKHARSIHSIYLVSGDKDMMPVLDCAKENNITIHVIGKKENVAIEIVESASKTHYL